MDLSVASDPSASGGHDGDTAIVQSDSLVQVTKVEHVEPLEIKSVGLEFDDDGEEDEDEDEADGEGERSQVSEREIDRDNDVGRLEVFNREETWLTETSTEDQIDVSKSGFKDGHLPTKVERMLLEGKSFASWKEFDMALHDYEALAGWRIRRLSRNRKRFHGRCRGWNEQDANSCQVEIGVRLIKKLGLIMIRKSYLIHTCPTEVHKFRNGSSRSSWVQRKIMPQVEVDHQVSVKILKENLLEMHESKAKYWTVQRARLKCKEVLKCTGKATWEKIPGYAELLRKKDPATHVFWETGEGRQFQRIYIAPAASQNAFLHCRPVVCLDRAHTAGDYPMLLFLATCYDGENQVVIMAWALVLKENGETWNWFMEKLRGSYPSLQHDNTVFISDQDKGLGTSVRDIFPGCPHSLCTQHIRQNVRGSIDNQCASLFEKLVNARTQYDFEGLIESFNPVDERQQNFLSYIKGIEPRLYARHAFPVPRYGHTASNVAESLNSALKPLRTLPALLLCDGLWQYMMVEHYKRKQRADALPTDGAGLTEFANTMYVRLCSDSQTVKAEPSSNQEALMTDVHGRFAIKLNERLCDCGEWREMDFPCAHAIKFVAEKQGDPRLLAGRVWLTEINQETYKVPLSPISIDRLKASIPCLEPIIECTKVVKKSLKRKAATSEVPAIQNETNRETSMPSFLLEAPRI